MPINYLKQIQLGQFEGNGYKINPSTLLASIVEGFYVFSRDLKEDRHLIFNDGFPVLVFLPNRNDKVDVELENETISVKAAWASAGSIKNVYVNYSAATDQVFIVRFHPGAFYKLFGLDAKYFKRNPIAPFEAIASKNQFDIKQFFSLITYKDKSAFFEKYISEVMVEGNETLILNETLDHIHKNRGNSTVRKISAEVGVNYKWLERSFLKNIGLLPKEYIQLQRFIHAYSELVGTKDVDLMQIAVSNGYYDANHFLKDFKGYTGKTPIAYLKLQNADSSLRRRPQPRIGCA